MDSTTEGPQLNNAAINDGVMTVTIYLDQKPAGFAEAIGSLVLAQDLVKQHYTQRAMTAMLEKKRGGIIRPGVH